MDSICQSFVHVVCKSKCCQKNWAILLRESKWPLLDWKGHLWLESEHIVDVPSSACSCWINCCLWAINSVDGHKKNTALKSNGYCTLINSNICVQMCSQTMHVDISFPQQMNRCAPTDGWHEKYCKHARKFWCDATNWMDLLEKKPTSNHNRENTDSSDLKRLAGWKYIKDCLSSVLTFLFWSEVSGCGPRHTGCRGPEGGAGVGHLLNSNKQVWPLKNYWLPSKSCGLWAK